MAKALTTRSTKRPSRDEIAAIFAAFAEDNPEPKGELVATNAFTLLVAVVLSAQATDAGVNKATPALFKLADTPQKMVKLGVERITELVKTIGLYRNKAKNVFALSQQLIERYDGEVPSTREALETLPGVGRKTANVVLNIAFGQPTIAVDTHLFRVANRTGIAAGQGSAGGRARAAESGAGEITCSSAHHWLILHGRYVCKARKPECYRCIIAQWCRFEPKTPPPKDWDGAPV